MQLFAVEWYITITTGGGQYCVDRCLSVFLFAYLFVNAVTNTGGYSSTLGTDHELEKSRLKFGRPVLGLGVTLIPRAPAEQR